MFSVNVSLIIDVLLGIVSKGNDTDNQPERKISDITFTLQLDGEKKNYTTSSMT